MDVNDSQIQLIRKELKGSSSMKDFDNEYHVLSLLRVLKHPNIVQFHTAYSFDGIANLLFEYAECDLKHFLYQNGHFIFSQQEMFDALWGLSSGLRELHRYSWHDRNLHLVGCHYDLHPGNVLVKCKTFLLTDFGLTRLKDKQHGSRSTFKGGVRDYYAPECQEWSDTFEADRIGRPSDIWSFGCILAEVLTLMELGSTGVEEFGRKRGIKSPYGRMGTFHHCGDPHPGVMNWLEELGSRNPANETTEGQLALIRDMLMIEQSRRPSIQDVSARLFFLAQRSRYRRIVADYEKLATEASFTLKIELQRFKIWAGEVGLDQVEYRSKAASVFSEPQAHIIFEEIHSLMRDIAHDLVDTLDKNHGRPNTVQHFAIRPRVDKLWSTLSREHIGRMNSILETVILNTEELDGEQVDYGELVEYSRPQLLVGMKQAFQALEKYDYEPHGSVRFIDLAEITEQRDWNYKLLVRLELPSTPSTQALVEFVRYDDDWVSRSEELVTRISNLVSLWHQPNLIDTFPFLHCAGFSHFPSRQAYGLIFQLPVGIDGAMPITLVDVIERTQNRLKRPALEEIFMLAYRLAAGLGSFHKARWLHKGISPYNILFFPQSPEQPGDSLGSVRLVGFSHSRQSAEDAFTVGPTDDDALKIYGHPDYRNYWKDTNKAGFREEYDYYSLGLVLLELGRWKLMKKMIKASHLQTLSPNALKEHLLHSEVPQLASSMGSYYGEAVKACLAYRWPREEGDGGRVRKWDEFEATVVSRLTKCTALFPYIS